MEPIAEQIVSAIQTTINAITVAAGYHYNLTAIRSKASDFADVLPAESVVLLAQTGLVPADAGAMGVDTWQMTIAIEGFVYDDGVLAVDTKINRLGADLIKALAIDETRGGLALETSVASIEIFHTENNFTGVDITITINYRTVRGDPYTGA